jgi:hypothetical protein
MSNRHFPVPLGGHLLSTTLGAHIAALIFDEARIQARAAALPHATKEALCNRLRRHYRLPTLEAPSSSLKR